MFKISFWRYFTYFLIVAKVTALEMGDYVKRLRSDFVSAVIPVVSYLVLVYLGSVGLLQIQQINQVTAPLGDFAQGIIILVLVLATYIYRCIFVTPTKLYYDLKKKADRDNWNDVSFGEIIPSHRNLLGLAVVIKNAKLSVIDSLEVWVVGVWPDSTPGFERPKRFGYVDDYETDKKPVFSSVDLPVEKERVFVIANYDENDRFMVRARDAHEPKIGDEIELSKDGAYVLDLEYRAVGVRPKLIRYTFVFQKQPEISLSFYKYGANYKRFYK